MKNRLLFIFLLVFSLLHAQQDSSQSQPRILIIPYQSMMYFSDADPDIAHFSQSNEMKVRNEMRNNVEANVYHQLLASFDAISLMRATSLSGEEDLNRIYAATRYGIYSKEMKDAYMKEKGKREKNGVQTFLSRFSRKTKDQTFWISDSMTMLGMIQDPQLFSYLSKKYNEKYILFITQFEVNTSNKNSIEWMKQQYNREFIIHYNLFDQTGELLRAENLTIKAGNENSVKEINDKYLITIASRLKEILVLALK